MASAEADTYEHGDRLSGSLDARRKHRNGRVDLWPCNGQSNEQWNVNSNGTVTGVQSGLCLDVTGQNTANGTAVDLWPCNGQSNQQWSRS